MRDKIKHVLKYVLPYQLILYIKQLEVIFRCWLTNNFYEPEEKIILNLLEKQPPGCVIDVGLNLGQYSLPMSKLSNVNSIIAFEPQTIVAKVIKFTLKALKVKKVYVYEMFAGKEKGFVSINLKNKDNSHRGQEVFMDLSANDDTLKIAVNSLDNVVAERKDCSNVIFIKADVEGAEMQVLAGTVGIIEKFKPLVMLELQDKYLARFSNSLTEVIAWMQEKGYYPFYVQGSKLIEWNNATISNTGNYVFLPDKKMANL